MSYNVVTFVVGVPGSGKSYWTTVQVVTEFIRFRTGNLFTNVPLNKRAIAEHCERVYDIPADITMARLHEIPREELQKWKESATARAGDELYDKREFYGPWDTFADDEYGENPLEKAWIVLDEAHNYLPRGQKTSKPYRQKWEEFLGELRHRGASMRFLTQDESKVAAEVNAHAEQRFVISSGVNDCIPFVGIRYGDWYQLVARWTGKYFRIVAMEEQSRDGLGKWKTQYRSHVVLSEKYFRLYDSNNATEDGQSGSKGEALEYLRLKGWRFYTWFWWRNCFEIIYRSGYVGVLLGFFVWFAYFGGMVTVTNWMVGLGGMASKQEEKAGGAIAGGVGASPAGAPDVAGQVRTVLCVTPSFVSLSGNVVLGFGDEIDGWTLQSIESDRGRCGFDRGDGVRHVVVGGMLSQSRGANEVRSTVRGANGSPSDRAAKRKEDSRVGETDQSPGAKRAPQPTVTAVTSGNGVVSRRRK